MGKTDVEGLNPCFNGRYSLRIKQGLARISNVGLNPCFNGRYSLSQSEEFLAVLLRAS